MTKAVFGLADDTPHAERIVARLNEAGFRPDDISLLCSEREHHYPRREEKYLEGEKELRYVDDIEGKRATNYGRSLVTECHTKAPEGGVTGATAGGIIGGSLGLLAGIGALSIPGLGPFIAAGPIIAALSGSALGGALGLFVGMLVGYGIPEYEARQYENHLKAGRVLISVHTTDYKNAEHAKRILEKEGAKDISCSREKVAS